MHTNSRTPSPREEVTAERPGSAARRVRPLALAEHWYVIEYFHTADHALLETMGVEPARLVPRAEWFEAMASECRKPLALRAFSYIGWEYEGILIGHSNVANIRVGREANIHLHLWRDEHRRHGLGSWFFRESANYFLREFALEKLICEPHSRNPAPNALLRGLGLEPVAIRRTTPGIASFEQFVKRYEISKCFATE